MELPRRCGGGGRFWFLVESGGLGVRFRMLFRLSRPVLRPDGTETAGAMFGVVTVGWVNTGVDGDTESSVVVVEGVGGIDVFGPPFELTDRFIPYADVFRLSVRGGEDGT